MNVTSIIPAAGDSPLKELEKVVRQREPILGTILAMSPYDDPQPTNWLTFVNKPAPGGMIELRHYDSGSSQSGLVCIGDCYVEGSLVLLGAYRIQ